MKVLVIGKNGLGLMPTTPRKARTLLQEGKAIRVRRTPLTIRLLYKTGCNTQPTYLGIDTGSQHIGTGITTDTEVLDKSEHSLRSTMDKRALMETRKQYRSLRRYRKTEYRHPKFRPHTKRVYVEKPVKRNKRRTHWKKMPVNYESARPAGWLPPSVQSKADHHVRIISRYLEALPPDTRLTIEVARFDIAHMKDPTIRGEMYQKGPMYEYENVKAYVFDRDGYKCKVCGAKAGSKRKDGSIVKICAHHIDFKSQGATDNPDRMATVCDMCHTSEAHEPGGILYEWMINGKTFKRGYRDQTFMNILRWHLFRTFPDASFTYGNITNADRKALGLQKSHANDAVAIAAEDHVNTTVCNETTYYQQVRKKKRSLHEANPRKGIKAPNKTAKHNNKNTKAVTITKRPTGEEITFHLFDRVKLGDRIGWISGFTGTSAYVRDENNNYVKYPFANYNQVPLSELTLLTRNNNWLRPRRPLGKG